MPTEPSGVQIFGRRDSRDSRKALRFFRERRTNIHFVDAALKPPSRGELRRFVQRLGAEALLDREARAFRDQGLGYLTMDEAEIGERLAVDAGLLRLPLVRYGERVSAGLDEAAWKEWLRADRR